jgi:hypothetical protein
VLAGHYKKGRVYRPPLLTYDNLNLNDWVRDDLPDLVWSAVIAHRHGDDSVNLWARFQSAVLDRISRDAFSAGTGIDGRLTSLEAIGPEHRQTIVELLTSSEDRLSLVPNELVTLAGMYAGFPGSWLLHDPWLDVERVDPDVAASFLAEVVVAAIGGLNTLVKTPSVRWDIATERVRMHQSTIDEVLGFPNVAERGATEALIRSSFLSAKGITDYRWSELAASQSSWARSFWTQNWHATPCLPEEEVEPVDSASDVTNRAVDLTETEPQPERPSDAEEDPPAERIDANELSTRTVEGLVELFNLFLNSALDPALAVDLSQPEQHEVLTGLVARAARVAIRTAHHPDLWSGEHGTTAMRILAETEIVITWMGATGDPDIYAKYQRYGHGKRKLMRRHFEGLRAEFDSPPEMLNDASEAFKRGTGGSWAEDMQEVSVEKNFADKDLRQMAAEVGLEDLYRHVFQPASGVSHGEWWAIEDYAMQRCLNPLHRFHLIPSFGLVYPTTPEFATVLEARLRSLMSEAVRQLSPTDSDGDDQA